MNNQDRKGARSSSDTTSPSKKLAKIEHETKRSVIRLKRNNVFQVNEIVEQIRKELDIVIEEKIELIRNSIMEKFVSVNEVEKVVQDLIEDKYQVKEEKEDKIEEIGRVKNQRDRESCSSRVANFILGLRSTMDETMKSNFPEWILNSNLSFVNQWRVMFRIKDSPFVQIFAKRLDAERIKEDQFLNSLKYFRSKMNVEYHEGDIPEIKTDEEWEKIYQALKVRDHPSRSSLKILGTGITKQENDSTWKCSLPKSKSPAVLFMRGFPYNYSDLEIKQFLVSKLEDRALQIEDVMIVKNSSGKSIGEAFVFVDTFKNASLIYSVKNEHKFSEESIVEGKKTEIHISTLKIDKPNLL